MNAQASAQPESQTVTWHPLAALLAWLVPGLGHIALGEIARGAVIGMTIGTLWISGLLIGGISVLDRYQHPFWFAGQALMAPNVAGASLFHQRIRPGYAEPGGGSAYEPSFGRVNEQGILYTALAGLLNLLAILDVISRGPDHRKRPDQPDAGNRQ